MLQGFKNVFYILGIGVLLLIAIVLFFKQNNKNNTSMLSQYKADLIRAHKLWFVEGKTSQARALYDSLYHDHPDDPIILFLLGQMHWSYSFFDLANKYFQLALTHKLSICPKGREELERQISQKQTKLIFRTQFPVDLENVDIENLFSLELTQRQWIQLAYAFEERELFGLAIFSIEKGTYSFIDSDLDKERIKLEDKCEDKIEILIQMAC